MPRHCTVCTHAERAAIDAALVESEPNRSVARRFGLNRASVDRHRARHLRPAIRAADVAEGTSVHQRMTSLYARVLALLERAESMGDVRATAASQPITRVVTGTSNFVFGIDGIGDLEQR